LKNEVLCNPSAEWSHRRITSHLKLALTFYVPVVLRLMLPSQLLLCLLSFTRT
jgi:hypothetical protein